jgi:(4-(4-[2-(gamma-L-glutamylamino)ethyl]phenoxymethyl)furan-2-yl)methanamine synthase
MILGVDVGGAHIKLADNDGYARQSAFALWEAPDKLESHLRLLIREAPAFCEVVLTMTGELTDCYRSKAEGVRAIIAATVAASDKPVRVYQIGNSFVRPEEAVVAPTKAAASNWYALANFVAQLPQIDGRSGLLIDVGSTTTDIVPFSAGRCLARGLNDHERLVSGELVYTGAIRSPVCGIVDRLFIRGQETRVMNELFANMLDVNVVLGRFAEGSRGEWAADQTDSRLASCMLRLARMVGLDLDDFSADDACSVAVQCRESQLAHLADAAHQVLSQSPDPEIAMVSGEGEFTAAELCDRLWPSGTSPPHILSFSSLFGESISRCAPAFAIACLRWNESDEARPGDAPFQVAQIR